MDTEILIAGAGLAGLSLAASLQKLGMNYRLVEARDRFGGRILTSRKAGANDADVAADLGPSWIWPGQAQVAALLGQLGLGVFEQYSDGRLVYEDELGQVRRDLDYSSMAGSLRIEGGVASLTDALAAKLDSEFIHLSHRLRSIRKTEHGYLVDLEYPGGRTQMRARKVVLAIPPRLIANLIAFEPALPSDAIEKMRSIPTWMAGQAKFFAFYDEPFWRKQGLSGDAISRRGPLMEIHDACGKNPEHGVLFGFVGQEPGSGAREPSSLTGQAVRQLAKLFGPQAENPLGTCLQDWAREEYTATTADQAISQHPSYGLPSVLEALAQQDIFFASSEMAPLFGGFIEGALEASRAVLERLRADTRF